MKYCEKCGISVRGEREHCPLCNAVLHGEAEPGGFPKLPNVRREHRLWLSILALSSVAACIVCLLLNFLFRSRGLWSLFVLGGVACMWMTLGLALYKERNIPKTMVWEVFLIAVLCVLWDYFTGWRGWSINYVLPIVSMGVMVVLVFTCRLFHVAAGSLIVYLMVDALMGVVQLVLLLTGCITVPLPSLLCVGVSAVMLAAMLIFRGKKVSEELSRRFHV
ncbi:MAG: DUF6320 domain-containing protein [Oscillospiraceae bacterium]|jgi:hypothetical protein|nr:DUF6320 domain-containing protein [Oscillospiraceae bacterium]